MTLPLPDYDFTLQTYNLTEDVNRYVPGGYHPTVLGNILGESHQRKYRLMHKLGWGSYATVWLAQTTDESRAFVSVKITTAQDDNAQTQEVEMLQKAANDDDQSYSHVVNLLDHFKLHGPNGTHDVIVTDVVAPIQSLPKKPPAWRKAAAYGVAQAMAQLHASQIVHGDWHLGNIGIAMPQFAHHDPQDVMRKLRWYDITPLITFTPIKQNVSLPAYVISPCNIAAVYEKIADSDPPQIKVFDFGSAHEIGTHPKKFQCAAHVCAPEVASAISLEKIDNPAINPPADVWALGATIYEIVTGSTLCRGRSIHALPYFMCKLAGSVPPHWENLPSLSGEIFTQADAEEWWESKWEMLRGGCKNDEDTNALVRLLRAILVLDPEERPTAAQIVNDPWFQDVLSVVNAHPSQT